jgi:RNA polymerase sigma-70 factor, ECF subfamily
MSSGTITWAYAYTRELDLGFHSLATGIPYHGHGRRTARRMIGNEVESAIERCRGGDSDAFGAVVSAYHRMVRSWVAIRCPPDVDAEDIAHKAFIKSFEHIGEYQPGTNFAAWLLAIARNLLLAECKRVRSRQDSNRDYLAHALTLAQERALADEFDSEDEPMVEALRDCLTRLEPTDLDLVRQRYDGAHPIATLAADLGKTPGAVKKWLFTVRRKLQDCIGRKLGAAGMRS